MQDWDLLRFVLAIHRHGGLSAAARALDVTHATVARQLEKAEATLGAKLFDRFQSGLTATPAGVAAAERAEAIEAQVLALDLSLTPEDEGPLAITAPPLLMRTHLAADLADFAAAHPGLELSLLSDNRVFNLHRREADIAIRVTRTPAESLWGRRLVAQRSGYFAAPGFAAAHEAALAGGAAPLPIVSFTAWASPIPRELATAAPGARVAATADDMLAAVGLVKAGLGLTRMPFFVGSREPGLELIPTLPTPDYAPIWILTHPDLRRTPKVRLAMRFLAARFAANAALYQGAAAG